MNFRFSNISNVFKEKNYSYYFTGQILSLTGTWMQSTALGWLVYRLTGSSKILGFMGFINMLPPILFSYIAGVIADKIYLKKGLYITQSIAMFFAFLLGLLTLTGYVKVYHIFLIGFIMGIVGAFDMPFRQSFVVSIIPKTILHNAIALNSMMFNISRIIGPAIAGFIIKYLNEGWCFLINSFSYFFIIIAFYFILPYDTKKEETNIKDSFKNGLKYIYRTKYIKYPISFMFLLSFVIMPVIVLLPVYVKRVGGDSQSFGFLIASLGLGATLSGFEMASKSKAKNYVNMVSFFSILYGISLISLSLNRYKLLSFFLLFIAGIGTSRQAVGLNTIIQTLVKDEMRGRVISVYSLSFMGLAPLGNLLWGYLADKIGILNVLFLCGLWVLSINYWFYSNMNRLKKELIIMKEYSEGFQVL
ncbi:MAG: MFS transporter [Elusimicrobiota bacterium]